MVFEKSGICVPEVPHSVVRMGTQNSRSLCGDKGNYRVMSALYAENRFSADFWNLTVVGDRLFKKPLSVDSWERGECRR
jgi:hypothetical protein